MGSPAQPTGLPRVRHPRRPGRPRHAPTGAGSLPLQPPPSPVGTPTPPEAGANLYRNCHREVGEGPADVHNDLWSNDLSEDAVRTSLALAALDTMTHAPTARCAA